MTAVAAIDAVLSIDLAAVVANWRRLAVVHGAPCAGVVKADGYGLGAVPVGRALAGAGCVTSLRVSNTRHGTRLTLLLTGPIATPRVQSRDNLLMLDLRPGGGPAFARMAAAGRLAHSPEPARRQTASLPLVIAYGLAPKPDTASTVLALLAFGLTAAGFRAMVRARTWGVLAIGAAGGLLIALAATDLAMGSTALFVLRPALSGALLVSATVPFFAPIARFVSAR
jgi:hypothetical protein